MNNQIILDILMAFKIISNNASNLTSKKRIILGRALIVGAGFSLRGDTWDSPLLSDITSAFLDMEKEGLLDRLNLADVGIDEPSAFRDYKDLIVLSGLTFYSDVKPMETSLKQYNYPLNNTWFRLTLKGIRYLKREFIKNLKKLREQGTKLMTFHGLDLAKESELRKFIVSIKKAVLQLIAVEKFFKTSNITEIVKRRFDSLKNEVEWIMKKVGKRDYMSSFRVLTSEQRKLYFSVYFMEYLKFLDEVLRYCGVIPSQGNKRNIDNQYYFSKGQDYEAKKMIISILNSATKEINIQDSYINEDVLLCLDELEQKRRLKISILTKKAGAAFRFLYNTLKNRGTLIQVKEENSCHDRFIILDKKTVWHLGASIKDAGNRAFLINLVNDKSEASKVINDFAAWWSSGNTV